MAVDPNTQLTTTSVGNREELSDVINMITPEDTPIYSDISKGKCVSVHPEWEVDELQPPNENIQTEGDDYDYDAGDTPQRIGNYTQIMRKSGIISETQEAVQQAGNANKVKRQKLKRGKELRKDVELAIVTNNASVAGATREFGGLPTWIETNVDRGASGANGGFDINTGLTVAATPGTQRAFTKTIMDNVMEQGYKAGANFRNVYVSPYVKSVFVTFMSNSNVAPFRYAVDDGQKNSIIANADVYEGPFGKVFIKPNRVMAANTTVARNAFFVDTSMLSFEWLRKIHEDKKVARTGDAKKFVLIGEGTLKVHNEAGIGVAADLYGTTASS
ncbi:DUF5309 domain-containing protein [Afipia carboxidovorans]|uniref:DUF5309 domain-containing protein n=1 Tax=Afipia carboxidovorans TaxID=40137 RepID=UPI00308517A6|nr:DUF5309 domain-containing protein [Afipia carboxidovorans]